MRDWKTLLALLALAMTGVAQDPKPGGDDPAPAGDAGAKKAPAEPPIWRMSDKDRAKFAKVLADYLNPGKKARSALLGKVEKATAKAIESHSPLEDVAGIVAAANRNRPFNKKLKKGRIQEVDVLPATHGFPGGIGTVVYHLYLPKDYTEKKLWPLIFCMPNNRAWPNGEKFIQEAWLKDPDVAAGYIIAVPKPQSKGDLWSKTKSWARAMISLRHLLGTYGTNPKVAGPATDTTRVFVDGGDEAALAAARFADLFTGAILRNADGKATPGPNLRAAGQINGVPTFVIYQKKNSNQRRFAASLTQDGSDSAAATDANALGDPKAIAAWMKSVKSVAVQPKRIEYTVHEASFQRHHWINVLEFDSSIDPAASFKARADRATNEIRIEVNGITRIELFLSDAIVDLNRPIKVVVEDGIDEFSFFDTKDGRFQVSRNLGRMLAELVGSNHPARVYSNFIVVDIPALRERARAAAEAAKKKDETKGA